MKHDYIIVCYQQFLHSFCNFAETAESVRDAWFEFFLKHPNEQVVNVIDLGPVKE